MQSLTGCNSQFRGIQADDVKLEDVITDDFNLKLGTFDIGYFGITAEGMKIKNFN